MVVQLRPNGVAVAHVDEGGRGAARAVSVIVSTERVRQRRIGAVLLSQIELEGRERRVLVCEAGLQLRAVLDVREHPAPAHRPVFLDPNFKNTWLHVIFLNHSVSPRHLAQRTSDCTDRQERGRRDLLVVLGVCLFQISLVLRLDLRHRLHVLVSLRHFNESSIDIHTELLIWVRADIIRARLRAQMRVRIVDRVRVLVQALLVLVIEILPKFASLVVPPVRQRGSVRRALI